MEKSQPNTQEEEAIIACQRHTPKQETREVGMKWIHVIRQARKNQRNEKWIRGLVDMGLARDLNSSANHRKIKMVTCNYYFARLSDLALRV